MRRITPFVTLFDTLHDLDNLFRIEPASHSAGQPSQFRPPVECYTRDKELVLRAELPGVDPATVEVTIEGGALTLRGEKPGPALDEKSRMLFQEIRNGKFERVFTLPESVDAGRMKASFRNGLLEITIPAVAKEAVRTIPIEVRGEVGGKSKAA